MQLLEDGIIAALAAVGLVTLLYLLLSAAAEPRRAGTADAVALIPCRGGDTAKLEQSVRVLRQLRREHGGFRRIVILDLGMDEEAKAVAALLCREDGGITLRDRTSFWEEYE